MMSSGSTHRRTAAIVCISTMYIIILAATRAATWSMHAHSYLHRTSYSPRLAPTSSSRLRMVADVIGGGNDDGDDGVDKLTMADSFPAASTKQTVESFFAAFQNTMAAPLPNSSDQMRVFLSRSKQHAQESLRSLRLPSAKDEAWKFTKLSALFAQSFIAPPAQTPSSKEQIRRQVLQCVDEQCKESHVVFVDGIYDRELSNLNPNVLGGGVTVSSLSAVVGDLQQAEGLLQQLGASAGSLALGKVPDVGEITRNSFGSDVLTYLNTANLQDALLVRVAEGAKAQVPLQAIFYSSADTATFPKALIRAEKDSDFIFKQSYISGGSGGGSKGGDKSTLSGLVCGRTEFRVDSGARVTHTYVQELGGDVKIVDVVSSDVHSGASFETSIIQSGGSLSRVNLHVALREERCNATVNGIILANAKQSIDLHSSILHDAEACFSRQQQRNLIGSAGECIFKGRIRIPKHAQETNSGQLCRSLMLGKSARLIAMPTLEINADNVVCSHGASVADLDENSMFYLASRGINRMEARKVLLRSFAIEILSDRDVMDAKSLERVISKIEHMFKSDDSSAVKDRKYMSI